MTTGATATIPGTQPVGWLHAYGYEVSNNTLGLELDSTVPAPPYRGALGRRPATLLVVTWGRVGSR
ncbi:hypothetical protein SNK04_013912 [Fusarium graminearum]